MEILPSLPDNVGKRRWLTNIEGNKVYFTIKRELKHKQHNEPKKCFYIQELKFENDWGIGIRIGYYIIGKKGKTKGKWVWGQYCPMFPKNDLREIINELEKEKYLK